MYVLFRTVRSDNPLGKDYVLCEFDLDDILLRTNGTAALCGDNAEADEVRRLRALQGGQG